MSHFQNFSTEARAPLSRIPFVTSPRHLAEGGDPRHVTEALLAADWKNHSVPGYPHVLLESPYGIHLVLEPSAYDVWWRIHPMDYAWYAGFGGNTPVEIIAGFTDALLRPRQAKAEDVRQILTDRQWAPYEDQWERGMTAPDGLVRVYQRSEEDSWSAEAAQPWGSGSKDVFWRAHFSRRTPAHLLSGFVDALSDPKPLFRGMGAGLGSSTQTESPVDGKHLFEAHQERLKAARAAARRLRRATTTALPSPSASVDTTGAARAR